MIAAVRRTVLRVSSASMAQHSPAQGTTGPMTFAIMTTTVAEKRFVAPKSLPTGWHHTAVVIDGTALIATVYLDGAVVAIGNAPTALFRLIEMLDAGSPRPAAVIGMPVGFVGAAESKELLRADKRVPFIVVTGRKGGSAMAAAAINALASEKE